jgi:hypothetical protein
VLTKWRVIRVGGPNGDSAIRKFQKNDAAWFSDFPDKRRSIGGKFANFILCRGEHLTILTSSYAAAIRLPAPAMGTGTEIGEPTHESHG